MALRPILADGLPLSWIADANLALIPNVKLRTGGSKSAMALKTGSLGGEAYTPDRAIARNLG
jgi:hypothetical protein